jgi:dolichyl-phosphate-mannose--protein O-mannosyl transferase
MTEVQLRQRKLTNNFEYDSNFPPSNANELEPNVPNTPTKRKTNKSETTPIPKATVEAATFNEEETNPRPNRLVLLGFLVAGLLTRFFRISAGKYVLWDEAHFGKFGSHYLKRTFYFDVHPPLGKMLVGLAGYLAGYDGSFEFGSGTDYTSSVNYVGMRMFLACFSAFAVPFAYLTAVQLKFNKAACLLVGLMTLADVGFIGIGRLVLLDSMLIFFTTATTFYYSLFRNQKYKMHIII